MNIFITLFVLNACSSGPQQAPVSDRAAPPSYKLQSHRVSEGETLFSIAWRYGLDYKRLARHNGISSAYTIYPGQRLRLDVSNVKMKYTPKSSGSAPKSTTSPGRPINKTTRPQPSSPKVVNPAGWGWEWPAKGRVISRFSGSKGPNQGIDIAGKLGESVISAAPGVVVYAGSGLRGYGNLLIIKHSDTFLSAYAHNRRLLVGEGSKIKAGQKIAEIGSSGTERVKLHFEIRRDGKPVDPLGYLPRR